MSGPLIILLRQVRQAVAVQRVERFLVGHWEVVDYRRVHNKEFRELSRDNAQERARGGVVFVGIVAR